MLTSAYVIERPDGTIVGYNCKVVQEDEQLRVTPNEPTIAAIHFNLKSQRACIVDSPKGASAQVEPVANGWLALKL